MRWARAEPAAAARPLRGPGSGARADRGGHHPGRGGAAVAGGHRGRSWDGEDGPGQALPGRGQRPDGAVGRADQAETDLDFGLVGQVFRVAGSAVPPVWPADENGSADSSFAVGARLLEVVGDQQAAGPVAILVDDLQWADRRSVEALTFMSRRLSVDPVMALVTLRTARSVTCGWPWPGWTAGWPRRAALPIRPGRSTSAARIPPVRKARCTPPACCWPTAGCCVAGDRKGAVDRLRRANDLYTALRAAPFVARTEEELAKCRLGGGPARKQPALR